MRKREKHIALKMKPLVPEILREVFGKDFIDKVDEDSVDIISQVVERLREIHRESDPMDDIDNYVEIAEDIYKIISKNRKKTVLKSQELKAVRGYIRQAIENLVEVFGFKSEKAGSHLLLNKLRDELDKKASTQKDIMDSADRLGRLIKNCKNIIDEFVDSLIDNFDELFPSLDSQEKFSRFLKMCFLHKDYIRFVVKRNKSRILEKKMVDLLSETISAFVNNFGQDLALEYISVITSQIPQPFKSMVYQMLPEEIAEELRLRKVVDYNENFKKMTTTTNINGIIMSKVDYNGGGVNRIISEVKKQDLTVRGLLDLIENLDEKEEKEILNSLSRDDLDIIKQQRSKGNREDPGEPVVIRRRK